MYDSPRALRRTVEKRVLLIIGVLALIFLIAELPSSMYGIIVGGLCSLVHFRTICSVAERVIDMSQGAAQISTGVGFAARYLVNAGVLAYSYFEPSLSFPTVVIGLVLVKLVIIGDTLMERWQDALNNQLKNTKKNLERRE